jgi:cation transport ATPase
VSEASVNLATERAAVTGNADIPTLIAAVAETGKSARPIGQDDHPAQDTASKRDDETRHLKNRVIIAGLLTLPVFILEMGSHLVPGMHHFIAQTIGIQASWRCSLRLPVRCCSALAGPSTGKVYPPS